MVSLAAENYLFRVPSIPFRVSLRMNELPSIRCKQGTIKLIVSKTDVDMVVCVCVCIHGSTRAIQGRIV